MVATSLMLCEAEEFGDMVVLEMVEAFAFNALDAVEVAEPISRNGRGGSAGARLGHGPSRGEKCLIGLAEVQSMGIARERGVRLYDLQGPDRS